ncbi:MAG: hypothetical protein ACREBE_02640 [bacterium]
MTGEELLDLFHRRIRGPEMPFVLDDEVEVTEGLDAGRRGIVDLVAYAETPIQYLVDFLDGTDEYFPPSSLKVTDHARDAI